MAIDWKVVSNSYTNKPIGMVGFIDEKIAVIAAFFEDKDWNQDGKVDLKERALSLFSLKGKAVAEVANHAYADPEIAMRDPSIYNLRGQLTAQFAAGMVQEGMYKAWMSMHVGRAAGAVAGVLTQSAVKSFVIRKGLEKAVEAAYSSSMGR